MKKMLLALIVVALASGIAEAKEHVYQTGKIETMKSVPCGSQAKGHRKEEILCHVYVVRSTDMQYRIRQEQKKVPVLLPVGEDVHFRIEKDQMLIRVIGPDGKEGKEQKYLVVSQTRLADSNPEP